MAGPGLSPSHPPGSPAPCPSRPLQHQETNSSEKKGRKFSFSIGPDDGLENPFGDQSDTEFTNNESTPNQHLPQPTNSSHARQGEGTGSRQSHIPNRRREEENGNQDELRRAANQALQSGVTRPPLAYTPGVASRMQSATRGDTSAIDETETPHVRLQLPNESNSHSGHNHDNNQPHLRQRRGSRVGDVHRSDSRIAAEKLVQRHRRQLPEPPPPDPPLPRVPPRSRAAVSPSQDDIVEVDTPMPGDPGQGDEDYFPYDHEESDELRPQYLTGILSTLMRLRTDSPDNGPNSSNSTSNSTSNAPSGANTPLPSAPPSPNLRPTFPQQPSLFARASDGVTRIFDRSHSLTNLHLAGSTAAPTPNASITSLIPSKLRQLNPAKRNHQHDRREAERKRRRQDREEARITNHIATVISRHRYLTSLCRALMQFGAPTHRLEDTLLMSARALQIDCQLLYIPGCMIVSFDDESTHTAEVKLVREAQGGVDLGKLGDIHAIYKSVVHDRVGADEAAEMLDAVMARPAKFGVWSRVLVAGLAAASVAPAAFQARWVDVPLAFLLGCFVGWLAFVVAPRSKEYQHVFEVTAVALTSFLARALGSVQGGEVFCFSALAQSPMVLLLPGYTILCASLELQTGSIIAGSVRLVYAMIYTLCLGYGITIGSTLYGTIDRNATSATTCVGPMSSDWFHLWVPLLTLSLCIISQAKWKQMPGMLFIAFAGFWANFYSRQFFKNAQIASTLGALSVGILANLHSRLGPQLERLYLEYIGGCLPGSERLRKKSKKLPFYRLDSFCPWSVEGDIESGAGRAAEVNEKEAEDGSDSGKRSLSVGDWIGSGMAAALIIPAIYVQVPGGLAVTGSLLDGIAVANQVTGNATMPQVSTPAEAIVDLTNPTNAGVAFTVLFRVIQVSIGITVGLFMSALLVYPFGKRRSALFSF